MKPSSSIPRTVSPLAGALLIVAAVVAVWANSLSGPFVFDDNASIIDNPTIRRLASFDWLRPPATAGETVSGRPVLNFTLALNYAAGGLTVRGYHLVNILLHAAAALTLFGIVRRTPGRANAPGGPLSGTRLGGPPSPRLRSPGTPRPTIAGVSIALPVALVWALHPLQTSAVTYVVQRAEVLAGLFLLLTLYCFIRGLEAGASRRWFPLSLVCCVLGMGTKETMAAAPLLVLHYDRTFVAGTFRGAWQSRGRIHGALMATWLVLAVLVLTNHGRGGSVGWNASVSSVTYFLTQCDAIVRYLALTAWPDPLVFDYGATVVAGFAGVWWQCALLATLGAGTLWALFRNKPVGFIGACFFLLLAPSSSFIPVTSQTMAEHRMYLPLAAVVAAAGLGLGLLKIPVRVGVAFAAVVALAFGAVTFVRNQVYRSDLTLWQDTATKRPQNARAHHNLGNALLQAGKPDEAAVEFQRAIALQPEHAYAHFGLGTIRLTRGQWAEAAAEFSAALAADPHYVAARINYGQALTQLGKTDEASAAYQAALADEPTATDARTNLAGLLISKGREGEAERILREVIAVAPELAEAHYHLARACEAAGDRKTAETEYREALRLKPAFAPGHVALGNLLMRRRAHAEAEASYREAVRLDPSSRDGYFGLGNVLAVNSRYQPALEAYRAALVIDPNYAQARANLANCQLGMGRLDEAIANYEMVLIQRPYDSGVKANLDFARQARDRRDAQHK